MTATASPLADRSVVAQAGELMTAIFGPTSGSTVAYIGRGGACRLRWDRPMASWALLPAWLLGELRYALPDDVRFPLCTFAHFAADRVEDLPGVWTLIRQPHAQQQGRWQADPAARRAALEAIAAFGLAPTFIVDQSSELFIAWLLDAPCRDEARVRALNRALADRFGGATGDVLVERGTTASPTEYTTMAAFDPRRPVFRVPGSYCHDQDRGYVRLLDADLERRYALTTIDHHLITPKPAKKRSTLK